MSYVWEYISEEDKQRIGFEELTRPWWRSAPSYWVIDRDTGNFLFNVTKRHEDMRNELNYLFYWQGNLIVIDTTYKQAMHEQGSSTFFLTAIRKPVLAPELEHKRGEMLRDLNDAIVRALSMNGQYSVTVVLIGMGEESV